MVIEYQGKRYPVIGESDSYYICTEVWEEEFGEPFKISKKDSIVVA